jgi:hypothetical protein
MAGDGRDLRYRAARECQARYGGAAQIVEVKILIAELRTVERFSPRRSKSVARPRLAERVSQNRAICFLRPASVQDGFEARRRV